MKSTYRVLGHLIMISVVLQAAVIAWTMFGLGEWIQDGGVLSKAVMDDRETINFTAQRGAMLHGIGGTLVVPALALAFLIVSFFAKVPRGVQGALVVVVLVAIQVALGIAGHGVPWMGLVHAINAFLIIGTANAAQARAKLSPEPAEAEPVKAAV
jgi:heme A synthase